MRRSLHLRTAGLGAALFLLAACGGEEPTAPKAGASPEPAGAVTRDEVESCLADAGVELATGETPTISGELGIGIEPGSGPLLPGDLNAAVFVYASEEEAASAETSLQGAAFQAVEAHGNVLVVFAAEVSPETRSGFMSCIPAG